MTVWTISFEHLKEQNLLAIVLLHGLVFIYPDNIPVRLFEITLMSELSQHGLQPDDISNLVIRLHLFSLVRQNFKDDHNELDPSRYILSIHHLIQMIILLGMEDDDKLRWC